MVLVKNWQFVNLFILGKIGVKNVSYDTLDRKNAFEAKNTRSSKSPKIRAFPKGLVHGFGQKLAIFPSFYLSQNWARKCVLRYSR